MKDRQAKSRKPLVVPILGMMACAALLCVAQPGYGAEKDPLVETLVEKGVLSSSEAEAIRAGQKERDLPSWIKRMTVKGDLRLRYQTEKKDGSERRDRGRIRYRIAVDTKPADDLTVGLRLASGSSDPRSTNQTLQDTFSSKGINLDRAYVKYRPDEWIALAGGKFANPLFAPSDLLWDDDINPEGGAFTVSTKMGGGLAPFLTSGFFVLDEKSGGSDPLMYAVQPGVDWNISDSAHLKLAVAYYGFSSLKGKTLDFSSGTNTLASGGLRYDYDSLAVSAKAGFDVPFPIAPYVSVFGEYIKNPDPSENNEGFLGGVQVGSRKLERLGQWNVSYRYRRLERDAWPDVFPDSDAFGGATNVKGHEGILKIGLAKYASLGFDYYSMEEIEGDVSEHLLQVDLVFTF